MTSNSRDTSPLNILVLNLAKACSLSSVLCTCSVSLGLGQEQPTAAKDKDFRNR